MNKKVLAGLVIVIGALLIFWGVKDSKKAASVPATGEPIKIGFVYSMTGIASSWTEFGKKAADMAAEEINAAGGVNGRPIELIYEDSQTNPAKSVSAFQKLVTVDKVDAAVGDVWAFLTNPLVPLAGEAKTVLISPTVMDASVEKPGEYFFTLGHSMGGIENAVRKFFEIHPNAKTAGLLCWGVDAWGLSYTAVYEKIAKEKGVTIVEKTCTTDFTPNYRNEAAKIKAAKPDVVLINGLGDKAINTLRTFGITVPIIADSNTIDGFENQGTVTAEQLKDAYIVDWQPSKEYIEKYQKKYNRYPILESHNSYEAVRSIAKALEKNPDNLLDGLKKVKYNGVGGLIDFTSGNGLTPNKEDAKLIKVLGKGMYEVIK